MEMTRNGKTWKYLQEADVLMWVGGTYHQHGGVQMEVYTKSCRLCRQDSHSWANPLPAHSRTSQWSRRCHRDRPPASWNRDLATLWTNRQRWSNPPKRRCRRDLGLFRPFNGLFGDVKHQTTLAVHQAAAIGVATRLCEAWNHPIALKVFAVVLRHAPIEADAPVDGITLKVAWTVDMAKLRTFPFKKRRPNTVIKRLKWT